MALIRIQERPAGPNGSNAVIIFDHGQEYPVTISDPFSEEEEQQLEWYFEQYLRFPFLRQVQAQTAATSIPIYGEKLFKQVFADPEVYARYKEALQSGLPTLQFEIAGSPEFHRWHWEALKDPKLPQPLALQATMVRKNITPQDVRATIRPSPTINLLIVAARPSGKQDMGYRTISRPLVEGLRQAKVPVQIEILRPGTYSALVNHLEEVKLRHQDGDAAGGYYHVIHFDVHGALLTYEHYEQLQGEYKGDRILLETLYGRKPIPAYEGRKAFLFLEDENEAPADPLEAGQLADLLIQYQVPIAILNACQSGKQVGSSETSLGSRLMQAGVQLVLAMGYSVTVSAAQLLMRTLYEQLFAHQDLSTSIRRARLELYNRKERRVYFDQKIELEDWLLPVVYQNKEQRLAVREFTPEESKAYYERQAEMTRSAPAEPHYGFVGRDVDILQIERRLLTRRNILLVRGMGGAGKTTLLQHLGAWWRTTDFVEQVLYFGYDERAWTRQQILVAIAQKLLDPVQYLRDFQPLSLDAQQALLTRRLRAGRHLLILDNLESITGAYLAIQHTLSPDEQATLHRFLVDLAGGRTLVLLGSRGGEAWLAKETFADNVYDLPGLDPEAASLLADRILEKHHATKYRQDADFLQLLKLLDGFPLALEVVLANLARQTPTEVLAALQAGDVTMHVGDSEKRTENILRCIDYSHSNLSREAQHLLLCLAPFTSVFWLEMLDQYTAHLRQQPALAVLPFERWPEVLREATNWGLLSPDPNIPSFLHLQPILPYFLRTRLGVPEQAEVRRAVDTAFRELYDQLGVELRQLLESKDPQERQLGQVLTSLEYENLVTALKLALAVQVSIQNPYFALSGYLDTIQDQRHGLELGQTVLGPLEAYPADKLADRLGTEFVRVIGDIANRQLNLKQYEAAEVSYLRILKLVLQLKGVDERERGDLKAKAYHNLGIVAQEQRQFEQAEQYYQQALQLYIEYDNRYEQAMTYHQLGAVAQQQRQFEQAEQYYQQALQLYIEYNDRYEQAKTYHQLGIVAQEQRKFEQAEQYYQQALQLKIEYNARYEQAMTYHQLGIVAQQQRQFEQAEQYYQQALQLKIEYNARYEQAMTYIVLGAVAQQQRQFEQAEQYYQQALQLYIEYHDRYSQAGTYHQLGIVAQQQRQFEQAEQYYQQALQLKIEYNARYEQAMTYIVLGAVAQEQRQFEQAEQYYQQALQLYIEYHDRYSQAGTYHNLGILAQEQRKFEQAEQYYQQALQIKIEYNDRYAQASTYHQLGIVAQEQRQWQQARSYFLSALETFLAYEDAYSSRIVLRSLARLWQTSSDADLPAAVAFIVGTTPDEAEALLRGMVENTSGTEET